MTKFKVTDASRSAGYHGQKLQWVVCSDFGGDEILTVTVILNNPPRNTFYDKHVLRKDENPVEILLLRNSAAPYKQVYVKDGKGDYVYFMTKKGKKEKKQKEIDNPLFRPELANTAEGMGIKSTGAPASTVISLKGLDFNQMIFDFAKALVHAKREGKFAAKNTQEEVTIVLSKAESVITVSGTGSVSKGRSLVVGGEWTGGDDDEIAFEVNHCDGVGDE